MLKRSDCLCGSTRRNDDDTNREGDIPVRYPAARAEPVLFGVQKALVIRLMIRLGLKSLEASLIPLYVCIYAPSSRACLGECRTFLKQGPFQCFANALLPTPGSSILWIPAMN